VVFFSFFPALLSLVCIILVVLLLLAFGVREFPLLGRRRLLAPHLRSSVLFALLRTMFPSSTPDSVNSLCGTVTYMTCVSTQFPVS
jgi:hypothetical protein